MPVVKFHEWQLECSPEATRNLYAKKHSDAELSMTPACQNLIANRDNLFPRDIYKLLHSLGIDPANEYEQTRLYRTDYGHLYQMSYYFIGQIKSTGQPMVLEDICQIGFEAHEEPFTKVAISTILPWRIALDEPEA